jgi:hypothetical protein
MISLGSNDRRDDWIAVHDALAVLEGRIEHGVGNRLLRRSPTT